MFLQLELTLDGTSIQKTMYKLTFKKSRVVILVVDFLFSSHIYRHYTPWRSSLGDARGPNWEEYRP